MCLGEELSESVVLVRGGIDYVLGYLGDEMNELQYEFNDCGSRNIPGPTAIDLFSGAGGFSCGIQMAGINVVAAVELDPNACWTLRINAKNFFPYMRVIEQDIRTLSGDDVLRAAGIDELDILIGSPPCQGFSTMNVRGRGIDNPNSLLVKEYVRMVREIQPKMFAMENVPGMFQYREYVHSVMEALEKCGYVVRVNLLNASGYGVPQHRVRVFLHGDRIDQKRIPSWPVYTHFNPEHIKSKDVGGGIHIPVSSVAIEMFPHSGFDKEALSHLKYNKKMDILMDARTMADDFDQAVNRVVFKGIVEHVRKNEEKKT